MQTPVQIPPRTSSIRSVHTTLSHDRRQKLHRRLPWLDGNAPSKEMPGGFDDGVSMRTSWPSASSLTIDQGRRPTMTSMRFELNKPVSLTPSVPESSDERAVSVPQSSPSSSTTSSLQPKQTLSSNSEISESTQGAGTYTPSTYTLAPPSSDGRSIEHLARTTSASYERLVGEPFSRIATDKALPGHCDSSNVSLVGSAPPSIPQRSSSLSPISKGIESFTKADRAPSDTARADTDRRRSSPSWSAALHDLPQRSTDDRMAAAQGSEVSQSKAAGAPQPLPINSLQNSEGMMTNIAPRLPADELHILEPIPLSVELELELESSSDTDATDSDDDLGSEHSMVFSSSIQSDHTSPTSLSWSDRETSRSPTLSNYHAQTSLPDDVLTYSRQPGHETRPVSLAELDCRPANPSSLQQNNEVEKGPIPFSAAEIEASSMHRLYNPPSADSIVIDFAYVERQSPFEPGSGLAPFRPTSASKASHEPINHSQPMVYMMRHETRPRTNHQMGPRVPRQANNFTVSKHDDTSDSRNDLGHSSKALRRHAQSYQYPVSLERSNSIRVYKYKRKGIAREWSSFRKRIAAIVACLNTTLVGLVAGIYAGEVPKIQYQLADLHHRVILGNVLLYICLGLATFIAWPLPLLHGRKPYILTALALTLPLQFPQALAVAQNRDPSMKYYVGLLLPRAASGLCLGFANVNFIATLFDLFGASLQSHRPHQEIVDHDDVRRQGGGMGLWLGVWAFCFVGSLAVGFLLGAIVTAMLDPAWGFYFMIVILAVFLFLNVLAPETRRAHHRRSILHYFDEEQNMQRKVARGEVKLHLSKDGPRYWWEEISAGLQLMGHMMLQPGFVVLAFYTAWIYAMVCLTILLLGALLSTEYAWKPEYVGVAVFALAIGALFAVPLSKANIFSRRRSTPARTDSMTLKPSVAWSSHLTRRCLFTFALPIVGLGFVFSSPGPQISWTAPVIMSGLVGFLSTLAIAECIGLVMETFDTCDLQPGVNTKHRLQSLESTTRRRRTNYSSFPRVAAGIFVAQGLGFFLAAAATGVSGHITRAIGAQKATGVTVGVLLFFTVLLTMVLWRFRTVQVIPNHALGTKKGSKDWTADNVDHYWKPVIVGNPSGKHRRMNLLESGRWSRWTEIRRLNKLSRGAATV